MAIQRARFICSILISVPLALMHWSMRPAHAATIHVPADFATIQAAINAAVNGDEVLIAPGTYTQGPVISLVNKAITVRGSGGAAVTILQSTGSQGILTLNDVESDTIIDGLSFANSGAMFGAEGILGIAAGSAPTIRNCAFVNNVGGNKPCISGTAGPGLSILNCAFTDNQLQSIALGNVDGITIDGCTFTGNSTNLGNIGGAAISLVSTGAAITNCTFNSNSWTGSDSTGGGAIAIATFLFDVSIDNCTFNTNASTLSQGGAIYALIANNDSGSVAISNCEFTGNTAATIGGGILAQINAGGTGSISIQDCTFQSNSAATGGGAYLRGGATATGCTFTNNLTVGGDAGRGAGLAVENSIVTNCMFTGNQSTGNGGAMYALGTTSVLTNCNASGNSAAVGLGGGLNSAPGSVVALVNSVLCANTPSQIEVGGFLSASNVIACDQPMGPVGACCLPQGGCVITSEASCVAAKGTYQGNATSCENAGCPDPKPNCVSDIAPPGGDDAVNVSDLLKIINDWGVCP